MNNMSATSKLITLYIPKEFNRFLESCELVTNKHKQNMNAYKRETGGKGLNPFIEIFSPHSDPLFGRILMEK